MNTSMTIECAIDFGRKRPVDNVQADSGAVGSSAGRSPRVAKFMALAWRFDQLVRDGIINNFAALARLGHVTRARMSQIMSLLHLAPDIQEDLLFLTVQHGKDPLVLRDLLPLTQEIDWRRQRRSWGNLVRKARAIAKSAEVAKVPSNNE
jgi:hypothetical protein